MHRIKLSNSDVRNYLNEIIRDMAFDDYVPDMVVGVGSPQLPVDGAIPARMLAEYYNAKYEVLTVDFSNKNEQNCSSNCWLAEDAFGAENGPQNILIVLGFNDTNKEIEWIKQDWEMSVYVKEGAHDHCNREIWGQNVRFVALVNDASVDEDCEVFYCGEEVMSSKYHEHTVEFPWNNWWSKQ